MLRLPPLVVLSLMAMVVVRETEGYSGKVLLVSMDGFRWDYVKTVSGLRHFPDMAATGCTVEYVNNTFVTKTFPCHYSIVTGLYEESHGIVANRMYNRTSGIYFGMSSKEEFWWNEGEPIWVTAEKQKANSTAVFFWPGSETRIQGYRPSIFKAYNKSVPFPERVQTAISWFVDDHKDFVALYFHEPDTTGHTYGPGSQEVADKVREMDGILGSILQTLDEKNLRDTVNVIVTSDHGMTDISMQERLIDLWDYVNRSLVDQVPDSGTVTAILPKEGQEDEVFRQVQTIPNVTAYRKADIPDRYHYKHNDRIMPIIIMANEGWMLSSNVTSSRAWNASGNHGYSSEYLSMRNIFFARGPDFRKGKKLTSIRTVDIYPLLCRLLNIRAAPNNGSVANTAQFLVESQSSVAVTVQIWTVWSALAAVVAAWLVAN